MDVADCRLRHIWIWLLSPARMYPGPRYRIVADGARRGRLVAFILLLSWPGRRPRGLRLWFCSWRAGAPHFRRRSGGDDGRDRVLAAAASSDLALRTQRRLGPRPGPRTAFLHRAGMAIMRFSGPGLPAHAAEVTAP